MKRQNILSLFALLVLSGNSYAGHISSGCLKGEAFRYTGVKLDRKADYCYLKTNTELSNQKNEFTLSDIIVNCSEPGYLTHYHNWIFQANNGQLYFNTNNWIGSYDNNIVKFYDHRNTDELKTITIGLLDHDDDKQTDEVLSLEVISERIDEPDESYRVIVELNKTCIY